MALVATLIFSTFALGNDAFAFIQPSAVARITTNTGITTCETTEGESCGVGTAKAQFRLLIKDVEDGFSTGVAQGVISIHGTADDNRKIVRTFDNLSFEYDSNGRFLSIAGNDNEWRIDAVGTVGEFKNGKAKIDIDLNIVNPAGVIFFVESLKGIVTLDPAEAYNKIKIVSKGPATCETPIGADCGSGLLKSKVQLLEQETTGDFSTGIGEIRTTMNIIAEGVRDIELEFRSKSLSYQYDGLGNVISIQGSVKASNGSTWQLEMNVKDLGGQEGEECSLRYSNSNGAVIEQPSSSCSVVLLPVDR